MDNIYKLTRVKEGEKREAASALSQSIADRSTQQQKRYAVRDEKWSNVIEDDGQCFTRPWGRVSFIAPPAREYKRVYFEETAKEETWTANIFDYVDGMTNNADAVLDENCDLLLEGDWGEPAIPQYEQKAETLSHKPETQAVVIEGESLSSFHARNANIAGESLRVYAVEHPTLEVQVKVPVWQQQIVVRDPWVSNVLEQASGDVMQFSRSKPPVPAYAAGQFTLPACEVSVLGQIKQVPEGSRLNLLREAQRYGPAHAIFCHPSDVNAALQSWYRPYVAVRLSELSMPRQTLAYWWNGTSRYIVAVYWSPTERPNTSLLRHIEFVDTSPLTQMGSFKTFVWSNLHPHTVAGIVRRAYAAGRLCGIDVEGEPTQPREVSFVLALPGSRPMVYSSVHRLPPGLLFVAKGAYAEYRYLESVGLGWEFTAKESGLIDMEGYVEWAPESKLKRGTDHRSVDGAAQVVSRALNFSGVTAHVSFFSPFKQDQTDMFLRSHTPVAPQQIFKRKIQHNNMEGEAGPITRRQVTSDMSYSKSCFLGFTDDRQLSRIDVGYRKRLDTYKAVVYASDLLSMLPVPGRKMPGLSQICEGYGVYTDQE